MRLKSVLSALGIAVAIVLALDYASFAATGKSAILGKLNKANKVTTFQRTTNGPAVGFTTKANQPPFAVNQTAKVGRLNADLLDGRDSSYFAKNNPVRTLRYTTTGAATFHSFPVTGLTAGRYLVSYTVQSDLAGASGTPASLFCSIDQSIGGNPLSTHVQGSSSADSESVALAVSATAVVDTANGTNPRVDCSGSGNWATPPASDVLFFHTDARPAEINVVRLDGNTASAGSAARVGSQQRQMLQSQAQGN